MCDNAPRPKWLQARTEFRAVEFSNENPRNPLRAAEQDNWALTTEKKIVKYCSCLHMLRSRWCCPKSPCLSGCSRSRLNLFYRLRKCTSFTDSFNYVQWASDQLLVKYWGLNSLERREVKYWNEEKTVCCAQQRNSEMAQPRMTGLMKTLLISQKGLSGAYYALESDGLQMWCLTTH